jgi:hypothetical protein
VTERPAHAVRPEDEARHQPDGETLWNESYYLDFVDGDGGLAGYVRIGLCPNLGVTWWTAMVVGVDRPVVASVAYDLPVVANGLELSAGGFDVAGAVERPLERMTLRGSVPARVHPDAASVYAGLTGGPTTLGLDLSWTTDGVPYHYDLTTRYEVPCLVDGQITVGDASASVVGHGQRDHSWGVRDWWAFGWCWAAARLDDGTRVHVADIRIPGHPVAFGYLQPPGGGVVPVEGLSVSEELGPEGMPTAARIALDPPGLELEVRPVAFGPLVLTAPDGRTSHFPRAAARFVADDGRSGTGWIEWNQPDPTGPAAGRSRPGR